MGLLTPEQRKAKAKQLEYLSQALDEECGLELQFTSAEEMKRYRAQLYIVRKTIPEFDVLAFIDMGTKMWIVRSHEEKED